MVTYQNFLALLLVASLLSPMANPSTLSSVIRADDIEWGYLNPLRGDKSPGAADLWGDRTKNLPTGMLVRFNKGFSSPPHIHNITYRGVVIKGLMHNDDPSAEPMWMPTGSFWTQPAGENHITSAEAETNLIFLEIDSGPYLVKPSDQHFDNPEKPINLHASNLVWLDNKHLKTVNASGVEVALLWGSVKPGKTGGVLIKFPTGFKGSLDVKAEEFRAIVISGQVDYESSETKHTMTLDAGSYFASTDAFEHRISVSEETLIYIRTDGRYKISSP